MVPTVDLGFEDEIFCSSAIAGLKPKILSTFGFSNIVINEIHYNPSLHLGFEDADDEIKEQELIILNLVSMDKSNFDMNQVLTLLKNLDAKYVNGFFSYRDLSGREIYRIASGINPGLLDSDTQTHVLLMALDLYQAIDPVKAFETMLESASGISEKLHASICDSARAPLSKQMIEHLKSRAQEISHLKSMRSISEK